MTEWALIFIFSFELSCITPLFPLFTCNMFAIETILINDLLKTLISWKSELRFGSILCKYQWYLQMHLSSGVPIQDPHNPGHGLCLLSPKPPFICKLWSFVQKGSTMPLLSHWLMGSNRKLKKGGWKQGLKTSQALWAPMVEGSVWVPLGQSPGRKVFQHLWWTHFAGVSKESAI